MRARRSPVLIGLALLLAGALASLAIPPIRHRIAALIPHDRVVQLDGWRFGYRVDREVRIAMPDGVRLTASVYRPRQHPEKLATVLVRLPYHRLKYGEGLIAAEFFARKGFAVVVQDLRGTGDSEGEFLPYRAATTDGDATLDWIVAQPWSNGRVGTFGCSALGETQLVLARARHPALRAMVPLGAGGAIGSAAARYGYFGIFEGGIFELATGFGWFLEFGSKDPHAPPSGRVDIASALRELPVAELVQRYRPGPNGYRDFLHLPLADPRWSELGYLGDDDLLDIPSFEVNTWGDQTVGDTLAWTESMRRKLPLAAARRRHLVIAPGTHCHHEDAGLTGRFGELEVPGARQPYFDWYARWFDHWLRDRGDGLAAMPAYLFYVIGEQRWLGAATWPPSEAELQRWYLDSGGHANGSRGDGVLGTEMPVGVAHDSFVYDPVNPVPSHGGPVCCTGNPAERAGPVDQREVEERPDVLVYTSPPLQAPLRIAGPLRALLQVSSSARDTDFVARLVDVWPDGRAINIQEGALRARYRDGFARPALLAPGSIVELSVDMRSIAYRLPPGHRLRLDVTSSSFPRLERNLNTGGDNAGAVEPVRAYNNVHHGAGRLSFVELFRLPARD